MIALAIINVKKGVFCEYGSLIREKKNNNF